MQQYAANIKFENNNITYHFLAADDVELFKFIHQRVKSMGGIFGRVKAVTINLSPNLITKISVDSPDG